MHQPPTIPEGDEENEGIEQAGGRNHFSQSSTSNLAEMNNMNGAIAEDDEQRDVQENIEQDDHPPMIDTVVENEESEDAKHHDESEEQQESADETKLGDVTISDGEYDAQGQLDESGALAGIHEEERPADESAEVTARSEKGLPTLVESPVPPGEDEGLQSPRVVQSDEHLKPEDTMLHQEERRRSGKSGRDRSTKSHRDTQQVDFEVEENEDSHIHNEESEIRISREELLARYQAAEVERDRLKGINANLQQRLADYLQKRKGADDTTNAGQNNEQSPAEYQQRYQKSLSDIEALQERIKRDQMEYEKKQEDYTQQIQRKAQSVEKLKLDYVKLVKEIASKAVFARNGKTISNQEVDNYLSALREKENELIKARHENIRLKNQLKKREDQLKSKEELAEGYHMIDFEQLKIENQTYSEKIEERNEELMKLRKKISNTVQILSHVKEKLSFVQQQRNEAKTILDDKEKEVKHKRDALATIKRRRDRLRQENQALKQNSGLIGNEHLLRDYEERYDDIERCTEKLETLKKRHAEVTLMCRVLKKKISKV